MVWNWQLKGWPNFEYDRAALEEIESQFLHQSGVLLGAYKHVHDEERDDLTVYILSNEALKTSEIEGEYLDRESVQSSIRFNFGLDTVKRHAAPAEQGIAEMMVDLYRNFVEPLSRKTLYDWHRMIMRGRGDLRDVGRYRTHADPMQVVSGPMHSPKVHFEAPPSEKMASEMDQFILSFNSTAPGAKKPLPALTRAGLAHLYFVSIHPFEDGNGRIGRAIAEKVLSQALDRPTLIALSQAIEHKKMDYYAALERNNRRMEITDWLIYFAKTILEAQAETQVMIDFLIQKTKLHDQFRDQLNERQIKVINRMFREGPAGFRGGLSAENYITITGTSRATATRDLHDLVEKGVLRSTGELKSTRYTLNLPKMN